MPKIRQLPIELINQIAAGEVIERPASVVKEIVENAIDAGASEIEIDIEDAGSKLIRVRDNGCGIDKEDLPLAFSTHATSKIHSFEDLEHVLTLGFRGEALPSIASVSKTTLTSRAENAEMAWKIAPYLSNELSPAAHPQGTTIEVRDLFYNTPARKKFLKSERTERQHITQLLQRIALSKDGLKIIFNNHGKKLGEYGGNTFNDRIRSIIGEDMLEQAVPVDAVNGSMHLWGSVGLPTFTSPQTDKQYFFINGRMIRDKVIVHAIKQAYQDVMFHGANPIFALFLDMDPELVDVNAHPAKHEVRFREARMTHDFIYSTLNHALRDVRPAAIAANKPAPQPSLSATSFAAPQTPAAAPLRGREALPLHNTYYPQHAPRTTQHQLNESAAYYRWASDGQTHTEAQQAFPPQTLQHSDALVPPPSDDAHPLGYALGQIHGIFIVAENKNGLVLVDMHAAHERILYEKFKALLHGEAQNQSQTLLMPEDLALNPGQLEILESNKAWLQKLGFKWHITADDALLTAVPSILKRNDCAQILRDVVIELETYPSTRAIERLQEQVISTMCCHKAVRAHDRLSISEMNELLRAIETTPSAGQCNHGRPTWTQLDETQLGALFMRGQ